MIRDTEVDDAAAAAADGGGGCGGCDNGGELSPFASTRIWLYSGGT